MYRHLSEENYRDLVESSGSIIMKADRDLNITYMNDFGLKFFGYTTDEILGRNVVGTTIPKRDDSGRDLVAMVKEMKDNPLAFATNVHQNRRKNGELVWISWTNKPKFDKDGKLTEILSIGNDISKLISIEEALRESEERMRVLRSEEAIAERKTLLDVLETLPVMICLLKPDYHVVFANRAFRKMFGESNGRRCYEFCFNKKKPCEYCESYTVLKTGKPHHWEVTTLDGTILDCNDFPFKDVDGSPLILEMDVDITKQKHRSHYTRSLIEASLDPMITISPYGKITDVNEATIKATGFSREKLIGTDFSDYFTEPEKARSGYRLVFSKGMMRNYPLTIRHKNGKLTDVLYNASVFSDLHGKAKGVFAAARDITVLKHAEDELRKSHENIEKLNEELLRSNKELENFAYVASHDLQEPLRTITSFTQLIALRYDEKFDDNAKEYFGFVVDGGKRMYELINGLLSYSRIGRQEVTFSPVDLNKVFDIVKANMALKIKERSCSIECDKLPRVSANRNQMIQLFQNLISNSIKFSTDPPHVSISVKPEKKRYIFSFRDEGIGIEPQYFEKIFLIFKRLMPRNEYEGTGIGLSICKKIVENHRGNIWVESEPGKGSVFYFTLPKTL